MVVEAIPGPYGRLACAASRGGYEHPRRAGRCLVLREPTVHSAAASFCGAADLRLSARGLRVRCSASGYYRIMSGDAVLFATPPILLPPDTAECQTVPRQPGKHGGDDWLDRQIRSVVLLVAPIPAFNHAILPAALAAVRHASEPGSWSGLLGDLGEHVATSTMTVAMPC